MLDRFAGPRELVEESARKFVMNFTASSDATGMLKLSQSMEYSLLSGGKRTRPVLGILWAEAFGVRPQKVLPWGLAVELIHTYSLIHDDLPCMDDDNERRGRPTNHVVFGESFALLAGDTLLTEAFGHLARSYGDEPQKAIALVQLLSEAAGYAGMAGGQALDLEAQKSLPSRQAILDMHARKTGALFSVICEGVAVVTGAEPRLQKASREFGASLGLCFQLADDILDSTPDIEKGSLPELLGLTATRELLSLETQKAVAQLHEIGLQSGPLVEIVEWNQTRKL